MKRNRINRKYPDIIIVSVHATLMTPEVERGFNCLIDAAYMKGKHATIASYILAYLYSSELDYHFNNTVPLNLTSITSLYNKLCTVLNNARLFGYQIEQQAPSITRRF